MCGRKAAIFCRLLMTWGTLRKEGALSRVYIKIDFIKQCSHLGYAVFVLTFGCDVITAFQSAQPTMTLSTLCCKVSQWALCSVR